MFRQLKSLIHLQNDIFYSPTHNLFLRVKLPEKIDYRDHLLKISGNEEMLFEFLISNYNNPITKEEVENEFPECSDAYDKTLDRLRRDKLEGRLKLYGLIKKENGRVFLYLKESPFSPVEAAGAAELPLLRRENDYVNYDSILTDCAPDADNAPQSILHKWIAECKSLTPYDARCLMLLERLGFMPAFGRRADKLWFLAEAKKLIYRFDESDVRTYGGTELLIFARGVLLGVIEYIEIQLQVMNPDSGSTNQQRQLTDLLQRFRTVEVPENSSVNPLLLAAYYHYLGLTQYRNYLLGNGREHLTAAKEATERSLEYAKRVDLHLQVWLAFLKYDLGRICCELGEYDEAIRNIEAAVILRQDIAGCPLFSDAIKHDLYFEYLLARIRQTEIRQRAGVLSADAAQAEYREIRAEADAAYSRQDTGDTQPYIRSLLEARTAE